MGEQVTSKLLALPMRFMVSTAKGEVVLASQHEKRGPTDLGLWNSLLSRDPSGCWVRKFLNRYLRSAVAPLDRIPHG